MYSGLSVKVMVKPWWQQAADVVGDVVRDVALEKGGIRKRKR